MVSIDLNKNELLNAIIQNLAIAPSAPLEGQIYYNTVEDTIYCWANGAWLDLGSQGVGVTNLSYTPSATNGVVVSSTGNSATIPLATPIAGTNLAGLLSPADKTKLETISGTNSGDITLVNSPGTYDYITISGQGITLAQINLTTDVTGTLPIANLPYKDEDNMASDSASHIPTQQSVKAYVDNIVTGLFSYKGGYNASTNSPNLDSAPTGIKKGFTYTVDTAGTFYSEDVQAGDMLIAEIDNPTTLENWTVVNKNIPDIVAASETASGVIELATQAEVNTGTDAVRAITPATLKSRLGISGSLIPSRKYTTTIGDGSATDIAVTHSLGTRTIISQVYDTATYEVIDCQTVNTDNNTTTFSFNTAPTSNEYTVVITG